MNSEVKRQVKEAQQFFKRVSEQSEKFSQVIPDKQLGEKLRKVSESSSEVVRHIEEKSGSNA